MGNISVLCDLFCTVVDNYGDIGVTWRLARQLADEHGHYMRLWVDDLQAFRHIQPEINPNLEQQWLAGVEIRRWITPLPDNVPGDVVIEALACNLPESFICAMADKTPAPVWLNLEYLSAENWVTGVHGLPSPHPRHALVKYFFYPGFTHETGGLTRESKLLPTRDAFQGNNAIRHEFRRRWALPDSPGLRVSLFSYENASLPGLLTAMAAGDRPCDLLVPVGRALPNIARWFGLTSLQPGDVATHGNVRVIVLPMLPLDAYDQLLWDCDLNFVRGEDSFLRAQFAGRPMIWQAYRQDDGAHLHKLDAFLDHYCAKLPPTLATELRLFWQTWNRESDLAEQWQTYLSALPVWQTHAHTWAAHLAKQPDLASNLVKFINKLLECPAF